MSNSVVPSALDASTQTFPSLSEAQIDRLRPLGAVRSVSPGDVLFRPNDTGVPLFVVLSGGMEIVQSSIDGEKQIATHGPGQFTGEITVISGQRCMVLGRVTEGGEFLEVSNDAIRPLVAKDAELGEVLLRAFILRRLQLISHGAGNAVLMGSHHSAGTLELREFLSRNGYPYSYIDLDVDCDAQALLDRFDVKLSDIPVVICNGANVLRSPSIHDVAQCLGMKIGVEDSHVRDLIIIGAGPAGLAAAVYAASEGLDVLLIETLAPGGQAGSSSKIENYLGFPTGVSGQELAARAITQAQKFGAEMIVTRTVTELNCARKPFRVVLEGGEELQTQTVVIATGAQYKKLPLENLEKFEGNGIYYGATYIESQLCGDEEVVVVGGGNSAGQAAVFLSQTVGKVHMLVRSAELRSSMSRYLIQRLTDNPKIELHYKTEITALEGSEQLDQITWRDQETGEASTHTIHHLFLMTGATPRTDWIQGCVALDKQGFILTGRDLDGQWSLGRPPQMLETSLPGVFAVGDVRSGNVKRVASAVGEGAIGVHMVHRALAEA